jgi:hypothetical protein
METEESFYVICREATLDEDFNRWRIISVRKGVVAEGLNDFGYGSVEEAVGACQACGLLIYTESGVVRAGAQPPTA